MIRHAVSSSPGGSSYRPLANDFISTSNEVLGVSTDSYGYDPYAEDDDDEVERPVGRARARTRTRSNGIDVDAALEITYDKIMEARSTADPTQSAECDVMLDRIRKMGSPMKKIGGGSGGESPSHGSGSSSPHKPPMHKKTSPSSHSRPYTGSSPLAGNELSTSPGGSMYYTLVGANLAGGRSQSSGRKSSGGMRRFTETSSIVIDEDSVAGDGVESGEGSPTTSQYSVTPPLAQSVTPKSGYKKSSMSSFSGKPLRVVTTAVAPDTRFSAESFSTLSDSPMSGEVITTDIDDMEMEDL